MRYPHAQILIFAKAPVPGYCKTRLARRLGNRGAALVYSQLLEATVAKATRPQLAPTTLCTAPDTNHGAFHGLRRRYGIPLQRQPTGNLGRRMHLASQRALQTADAVLIVGTDCPELRPDHLERALALLNGHAQAVFLPTYDGGYALIGLSRAQPALFRGVAWSTPRVWLQTQRRARSLELACRLLQTVNDLDDVADYRRARRHGLLPPVYARRQARPL